MREILLSFKPEIFDLIRTGKKIYEYRYQFCNQPIKAYMYVSKPVQQIVGYLELDKRILLEDWKEQYKENSEILKRVEEYISRNNRYVMPIKSFHMTKPIPLNDLKKGLRKFIIPQSYYYLDHYPELWNFIKLYATDTQEVIINHFYEDDIENICVKKYE